HGYRQGTTLVPDQYRLLQGGSGRPQLHRSAHQIRNVHRRRRRKQPVAALPCGPRIQAKRKRRYRGFRDRPNRYSRCQIQDVQAWLHRQCRVSLQSVLRRRGMAENSEGAWLSHPELQHLERDPDATIPALENPEQYLLFVTGGATHIAHFFYGAYGIATRRVY